jgi:hypothetical protein
MNAIYKITGQDGREYGPATPEQIRQWIGEGRVERQTPVFVTGEQDWSFVGLRPEFAGSFVAPSTPPRITPSSPKTVSAGQPRKTNSCALMGMIFGILSVMCCCGCPFGILGLVFSLIGLSQINANPQLQEGRGMAIAGLVLSLLSLLIGLGWVFINLLMSQPHILWNASHY